MGRLSISVADETERWAKQEANRRGIYLSGLIEQAILEHKRNLRNHEIVKGLLEDAEFDQAMANNEWEKVEEMEAADKKRREEEVPAIDHVPGNTVVLVTPKQNRTRHRKSRFRE